MVHGTWSMVSQLMGGTVAFIKINPSQVYSDTKPAAFYLPNPLCLVRGIFSKALQYKLDRLQMFWYSECWGSNSLLMNCILMSVSPVYLNDKELIWLCNESHNCITYWAFVSILWWSMITQVSSLTALKVYYQSYRTLKKWPPTQQEVLEFLLRTVAAVGR